MNLQMSEGLQLTSRGTLSGGGAAKTRIPGVPASTANSVKCAGPGPAMVVVR
jgi:hypothetical protein